MLSCFPAWGTLSFQKHSMFLKGVSAMGILLAAGEKGLLFRGNNWQKLSCPLPRPELLARDGLRIAVVDNARHLLWTGRSVIPVDSGVEQLLFWHDCVLTLSGDTDCLTLLDWAGGTPITTMPVGVYPQDMCLLPGGQLLAVCGGADSLLRLISLPECRVHHSFALPGNVQRVTCTAGQLYVLCALEDDGLKCLLYAIPLHGTHVQPVARWPGLPGAIHADSQGRLWVAASEMLCCFAPGSSTPTYMKGDFGLIRRMDSHGGLLISDPVLDTLSLWTGNRLSTLSVGNVQHGLFV